MEKLTEEGVFRLFPDFEFKNHIATSGDAFIYKVGHADYDYDLALKVNYNIDPNSVARFKKEAHIFNCLDHEYVMKMLASGSREGWCFTLMKYIEYDLLKLIASQRFSDMQAGLMVCKIASALHYLHTKGILHRDIKPANVMITECGSPKIIDLGLAYIAGEDLNALEAVGSEGYAAPEIWDSPEKISIQSDLYALGALLYTVLTEVYPDPHKVDFGKLFNRDQGYVRFILKAMNRDATQRHTSAHEFLEELEELVSKILKPTSFLF
ncbi:serine/threonine protein kinase [Akkermansiaceae bacterium]|nr:serine/threonine protein kinase [Akkermansiaceae bacterium]